MTEAISTDSCRMICFHKWVRCWRRIVDAPIAGPDPYCEAFYYCLKCRTTALSQQDRGSP